MQKTFLGIALFCAATALFSCTQDPLKDFDCTGSTPTYTTDIAPIMAANCTGCHGTTNPSDNLDLTTYAKVKAEGDLF